LNFYRAARSPSGLRGSNAVDMRTQPWGELRAVEQGWQGRWWFECPKGHRQLRNATFIRSAAKAGRFPTCKECERCKE
jgi:hypothetical protein